jgi:hypothetical protein
MIQQQSTKTRSVIISIMAILAMAFLLSGNLTRRSAALASPTQKLSPDVRTNQFCTNQSLRGNFGFSAQGVTLADSSIPAELQGSFASSGFAEFDGAGNLTLTATTSLNGVIQGPTGVKGSYQVNGDCTFEAKTVNGTTFRGVIVNGGAELFILQTTPGVAITVTAKKL